METDQGPENYPEYLRQKRYSKETLQIFVKGKWEDVPLVIETKREIGPLPKRERKMGKDEMLEKLAQAKAKMAATSDASFTADAVDLIISILEEAIPRIGPTLNEAQMRAISMQIPYGRKR